MYESKEGPLRRETREGSFGSTLAASEWPAEKREGPRGPGYCLHATNAGPSST